MDGISEYQKKTNEPILRILAGELINGQTTVIPQDLFGLKARGP